MVKDKSLENWDASLEIIWLYLTLYPEQTHLADILECECRKSAAVTNNINDDSYSGGGWLMCILSYRLSATLSIMEPLLLLHTPKLLLQWEVKATCYVFTDGLIKSL